MAIKLEITASSAAELGEHVSSLALMFNSTGANALTDPVMPEIKETAKVTRSRAKAEPEKAAEPVAEETKAEDPQPEPEAAKDPEPAAEPEKTDTKLAEAPAETTEISVDKDIMPKMFKLAEKGGREIIEKINAEFGGKPTVLPPEKLPAYLKAIEEALAA